MPFGRPTKLNAQSVETAQQYMTEFNKGDNPDIIPSYEGLAFRLDTTPQAIHRWKNQGEALSKEIQDSDEETSEEKYEQLQDLEKIKVNFYYTLVRLFANQKRVLVNGGLDSSLNSVIVKLALTNHGMSDKTQQEISGPDGGPLQVSDLTNEQIDARLAALQPIPED